MEYSGMIHNPNITYISYIPNITPLAFLEPLASFEPLTSFEPLASFEDSNNILNTTYAFIYLATISTIDPLIYLTTLVSFAYFTILEHIATLEPFEYLEAIKPFAYLAPLAILAFLTFITLLINASKNIKDDTDVSDVSDVSDDTSSDDTSSDDTDDTTDTETDDYTSSKIEECKVVNREGVIVSDKKKYRGILVDIWKTMKKQDIVENTTFKIKNGNKRGVKGYNWCEEIDMSFQSRDANATLREILHLVKVNDLAINLSITLKTDETVRFNIE
jgi:hypothetical protein